jgi:hypothetical protein
VEAPGQMDTLEPDYERETWRLYDELHRTRTSAVLWGVERGYCGYARWRVEQCEELEPGVVALTFQRQSVLVLLSSLEIPVRPFGPDCEPKLDLAAIGCDDPLKLPPRELVTGPPPADPNLAKALVEEAFARVLQTRAGGRLVNVEGQPPPRIRCRKSSRARARQKIVSRTCSSSTRARRSWSSRLRQTTRKPTRPR